MILLLDNHDSFTFNLAQYLGELGAETKVVFSDAITVEEVGALAPERIVISPGPGTPEDAGISVALVRAFATRLPILGVCLGHQAIACAFGAEIVRAPAPVHGKRWPIIHDGRGLFAGLTTPIVATRYHSLVVDRRSLPDQLEESARSSGDDLLMGLRHRGLPIYGLQFHPESIGTPDGHALLRRFLAG
jgi:anthranilate synthase component II